MSTKLSANTLSTLILTIASLVALSGCSPGCAKMRSIREGWQEVWPIECMVQIPKGWVCRENASYLKWFHPRGVGDVHIHIARLTYAGVGETRGFKLRLTRLLALEDDPEFVVVDVPKFGSKALSITSEWNRDGELMLRKHVYFDFGDFVVDFVLTCPADEFEQYEPIFDKTVQSFQK